MNTWMLTTEKLPAERYVIAWNGRQLLTAWATECGEFIEAGPGGQPIAGVTQWTPFPLTQHAFRYVPSQRE